ncbi:FAD/NAD(P)-binding protein [Motilibacter aurantiacus]|uniref:FAD/NAD(P)-binding protein n=1 Tax=Motilibacter aurantiacus TaxID=2714955 RepID=UPI001E2D894A|nr:FAD/NAD(P)-binding protein [Motilibacter aurantiacus]NHC45066.1 hypothetical protein [Motilibacter aurantiacus]
MSVVTAEPVAVAVVGAGAAGTLGALHLARSRDGSAPELEILLVDPGPRTGRGVAYSTDDPTHLLNVPAGRMSALPDDPEHFLRWLRAERDPTAGPGTFARRGWYGEYLEAMLALELRGRTGVRLRRVHRRAVALRDDPLGGLRLRLAGTGAGEDGQDDRVASGRGPAGAGPVDERVDAVVLALGSPRNPAAWVPPSLRGSDRLVADPWMPGALDRVRCARDVLLVGTGLTMVDVALTLAGPGRTVHAVSRSGRLPEAHSERPVPALPAPELPSAQLRLHDVRRLVLRQLRAGLDATGDWRPGLDSLRPVTRELWQRLPERDRTEFLLRSDRRWWETHRHRMSPASATLLRRALAAGEVTVGAGCVVDARHVEGRLAVDLADGQRLAVDAVVDCTGRGTAVPLGEEGLLSDLLVHGRARPGPVGIGLDVDADGRLRAWNGRPDPRVLVIGAARQGAEWESTAVPEIRAQAVAAARCLGPVLGRQQGAMAAMGATA